MAGSVPALLPLNVPLIGLEIYANPGVQEPRLGCGGIVRAPGARLLRSTLAPSPCSPIQSPGQSGACKHNYGQNQREFSQEEVHRPRGQATLGPERGAAAALRVRNRGENEGREPWLPPRLSPDPKHILSPDHDYTLSLKPRVLATDWALIMTTLGSLALLSGGVGGKV